MYISEKPDGFKLFKTSKEVNGILIDNKTLAYQTFTRPSKDVSRPLYSPSLAFTIAVSSFALPNL